MCSCYTLHHSGVSQNGEIMTKTTKIIITIMALFAVTSCRGAANPAANANNAEICTFPVEIHQVNPARPGDTLFLSPNIDQNLFGWVFHWDSPEGFLRDADTISPALIVPDGVEIVEVSLDVTDNEGCVGFGSTFVGARSVRSIAHGNSGTMPAARASTI